MASNSADLVSAAGTPPPGGSAAWSLLMPAGIVFIGEHADPQGLARRAFAISQCLLVRRARFDAVGGWVSFRKTLVAATDRSVLVLAGDELTHAAMSLAGPAGVVCGLRERRAARSPGRSGRGRRARAIGLVGAGLLGWVGAAAAHHRAARLMRTRTAFAPLAPLSWALFGAVLLDAARGVLRGTAGWKGRDQ